MLRQTLLVEVTMYVTAMRNISTAISGTQSCCLTEYKVVRSLLVATWLAQCRLECIQQMQ